MKRRVRVHKNGGKTDPPPKRKFYNEQKPLGYYDEPNYQVPTDRLGNNSSNQPTKQEVEQMKRGAEEVGELAQAVKKKTPGLSQEEAVERAVQLHQVQNQPQTTAREHYSTQAERDRDAYVFDKGTHGREILRAPLQFLAGNIPTEEERIQERIRYTDPNTSGLDKFIGTLGQAVDLAPSAILNTAAGLAFAPANYGRLAKIADAVSPIGTPGLDNLGRYVTQNTPLKNAYKLNPNARTAFANTGEKPHWLKGLQEEWNPTTPGQFEEMKNWLNKTKDKLWEVQKVMRPYSQAKSDLERYHFKWKKELRKGRDEANEKTLKKLGEKIDKELGVQNTPLKSYFNKLGRGSYGDVYELNSNQALKKWRKPEQTPVDVEDILTKYEKLPKNLRDRTIVPQKGKFSGEDRIEIMPKIKGIKDMSDLRSATPEQMKQVLSEVEQLNKQGIFVDISNPANVLINPTTGKATYLDLNTSLNLIGDGKYINQYPKELQPLLKNFEQSPKPSASSVDDVGEIGTGAALNSNAQEAPNNFKYGGDTTGNTQKKKVRVYKETRKYPNLNIQ